jgi:hypothetical protein
MRDLSKRQDVEYNSVHKNIDDVSSVNQADCADDHYFNDFSMIFFCEIKRQNCEQKGQINVNGVDNIRQTVKIIKFRA